MAQGWRGRSVGSRGEDVLGGRHSPSSQGWMPEGCREGWQEQEGRASEGRAEPQAGASWVLLGVKVCLCFGVR